MALRHLLLPVGDRLFGQRMVRRLRFLEEAQWWPRERIEEARDRALRETVRIAFETVPFYRELMSDQRVRSGDIRTVSDLPLVPQATKQMLREGYPHRTTRSTRYRRRENRTSGSTGTNFVVLADTETIGWYRAALLLMLEWSGWRLGEPQVQTGMNLERSLERAVKDRLLRCRYVSAYDLTDEHLDAVLERLDARRIEHLWGYPGSLYYLARRAIDRGWNRPLRSAVTWGDMLSPRYRGTISRAFDCRVYDTYGCAEGIQVAGECGEGGGYHVLELDTVVEFVDEDGALTPHGQSGSLLLTRLHPGPMPLIRYRVGDLGTPGPDEPCPCGRALGRLTSIEGRDTDVVVTPDGNRLIVHFFTGLLERFDEIDSFQVVQESIDSLVLRIVPAAGFTSDVAARAAQMLREHGALLRIEIEVVPMIGIEETGKRKFVISKVGSG